MCDDCEAQVSLLDHFLKFTQLKPNENSHLDWFISFYKNACGLILV